ncbi:MAG: hypothetical protein K6F39_05140 [Lachnospiraceae bacterium]|nr:hypothetical protein [Lachnospiraceae bacterium]
MSNLVKRAFVVCNVEEKKLIDSNQQVADKLNSIVREMEENAVDPDGFSEGLNAERVELLVDEADGEGYEDEGDTGEELNRAAPRVVGTAEQIEAAKAEAEEILSEARSEAEQIIADANAEAEGLRTQAVEDGQKMGFEQGREEGLEQAQAAKKEYEELSEQLEEDYRKKIEELEPVFIDTLTDIYEHVFHVRFGDSKDVIFHLIQDAVRKVEGNLNFIIHVSKEDYGFVSMQKKELLAGVSNAESAEIVEDMTLKQNECYIETGSGIFDCSLETQLSGLKKELRLLSYSKSKP